MSATHSTLRWKRLGYAQGTVGAAALTFAGLGIAIPTDTQMALINVEVPIRWIDDDQVPTPVFGMPVAAQQEFAYSVDDFTHIQLIAQGAPGNVNVSFYK